MDLSKEIYVSLDVETDGDIPQVNSMLSLGAAAFVRDVENCDWIPVGTFSQNLRVLPGAVADARTMTEFWVRNPTAWHLATINAREPEIVMREFQTWLLKLKEDWPNKAVTGFAGPTGFDFTFIRWYMCKFLGNSEPFGHKCDDLRSRASSALKIPYSKAGKSAFPAHWFRDNKPHTHVAVDDAVEQGWIYCRILEEL